MTVAGARSYTVYKLPDLRILHFSISQGFLYTVNWKCLNWVAHCSVHSNSNTFHFPLSIMQAPLFCFTWVSPDHVKHSSSAHWFPPLSFSTWGRTESTAEPYGMNLGRSRASAWGHCGELGSLLTKQDPQASVASCRVVCWEMVWVVLLCQCWETGDLWPYSSVSGSWRLPCPSFPAWETAGWVFRQWALPTPPTGTATGNGTEKRWSRKLWSFVITNRDFSNSNSNLPPDNNLMNLGVARLRVILFVWFPRWRCLRWS